MHYRSNFPLASAFAALLAAPAAPAATFFWDGNDGVPGFETASGTWAAPTIGTATEGWSTDPFGTTAITGNSITTTAADSVNFGFGARALASGNITITGTVNAGAMTFASSSGPIFLAGGAINLAAVSSITTNNAADTIGSVLSGAATSLTKSGTGTLTLTVPGTWTGTTIINGGTNSANFNVITPGGGIVLGNDATANTSTGLTLNNGGSLTLTNAGPFDAVLNRLADSAGITSNGGTIAFNNTPGAEIYTETIGPVALAGGQTNFVLTTNQFSEGSQTLTLGGLAPAGTASATFSSGGGLIETKNIVGVMGAAATPAGRIIGPWAITGTAIGALTDYAAYNALGQVLARNTDPSGEETWTDPANAYTRDSGTTATRLTATRNITALRSLNTANGASINATDDLITAANTLQAGDPVAFSATNLGGIAGGLALFNTYFVINPTETTFQVSATPGGPPINITSAGSGITFTPGILLPAGINLGTLGILSGATAAGQQVIAGTGALTLPSTTSGNLHVTVGSNTFSGATPNSPVVISAPITDNGSGVLTLVKNGSGNLALRGTNTFTGGIVVNGGNLIWLTDANLGAPDKPVTIAASTGLAGNTNIGAATSNRPFILNEGVIATFASGGSGSNTLNGPVQGPGGISLYHGNAGSATANLNNAANTFTGPIRYQGTNVNLTLNINSLADPVGAGNITFGHLLGGAQTMAFNLGATATAPMTLNNRKFELGVGPQVLQAIGNASTQALTINSNLLDNSPPIARTLTLQGNGTGLSTFAGNIVQAASTLGIIKAGTGTWVLSGINEYSGPTTINAGTLLVNGALNATIAVTVNSATLGGTGSIGAPVIVAAAGSIAPGASAGTLSIGGDLDLSAMAGGAGKLKFELGTLAGPNDRIAVTGTLTIGAGALGFNNFDFTNLGGLQTGTYTLVTCGGINAGDTLDGSDLTGTIGTATATLGLSGNNLVLNVVSGAGGYAAWQAANSTAQSIGLDHDNDGVSNGIEFFLGGAVNTTGPNPAPLPGVTNAGGILSVTWTRAAGYPGAYGTDFTVETSSSLSGVWVAETVGASVTISGNDVKYTFPAGSKNFARLKVTGP